MIDAASQALIAWEIARNENIVQNLANNPDLLASLRGRPGPSARPRNLVAMVDSEIARLAILKLLK